MKISCKNCNSTFNISDEKIPEGKTINLQCPKCKEKISVSGIAKKEESPNRVESADSKSAKKTNGKSLIEEVASDNYNAWEKPFDFVKEGAKTALICESGSEARSSIAGVLKEMKYQTTEAESARDALKKMRFHVYDLVVLDENFDTKDPDNNGVLRYLESLAMGTRRLIFVALTSDRFRTMDNMMAFNKSVNIIVNRQNLADFKQIISGSVNDNDNFFKVYKEILTSMGKL